MVGEAMEGLPSRIRKCMKNVAICVESHPTSEQLKAGGVRRDGLLLGLFEGVPETEWGKGFDNRLPDKITIFQESIEQFAQTPEEIEKEVRSTVRHEIAHYFGFDDEQLKSTDN